MTTATELTLTAKLISDQHGFNDYEITGHDEVHRICVPHGNIKGENCNVYQSSGAKHGAAWRGLLEATLSQHLKERIKVTMDMGDAKDIVISSYMSDGPGYCGDLSYKIKGRHFQMTSGVSEDDYDLLLTLPIDVPDVTEIKPFDVNRDADFVCRALKGEGGMDYYSQDDGALAIPSNRIRMLTFADGSQGLILLFGEPCWLLLVIGNPRLAINTEMMYSETPSADVDILDPLGN